MFLKNGNSNYFFDLTLKNFENMAKQKLKKIDNKNFSNRICILCYKNPLHKFGCNLTKSIGKKFNIDLVVNDKTVKTALYF